ncbi:MAG: hypothetical protein IJ123_00005, partial [Blautia sp.]|nr:hypothetical protein [Blautia sp.]
GEIIIIAGSKEEIIKKQLIGYDSIYRRPINRRQGAAILLYGSRLNAPVQQYRGPISSSGFPIKVFDATLPVFKPCCARLHKS